MKTKGSIILTTILIIAAFCLGGCADKTLQNFTPEAAAPDPALTAYMSGKELPKGAMPKVLSPNVKISKSILDLEGIDNEPLTKYADLIQPLLAEIRKVDGNFDENKYHMSVNVSAPQDKSGEISLIYWIGDKIATNKKYYVSCHGDKACQVFTTPAIHGSTKDTAENEASLLALVENFEQSDKYRVVDEQKFENVVSHEQEYWYDYYTDVLFYRDGLFYEADDLDGAICDKVIIEYLRGEGEDYSNVDPEDTVLAK